MLYGIAKGGFGLLYIAIPLILILAIYKNSETSVAKLEKIEAAINSK